jgi:hypothetical protein
MYRCSVDRTSLPQKEASWLLRTLPSYCAPRARGEELCGCFCIPSTLNSIIPFSFSFRVLLGHLVLQVPLDPQELWLISKA